MNYRLVIYVIVILTTTFAVTSLDLNRFFKQGRINEARVFIMLLIIAITELVSQFIINFLEVSKIL